MPAVELELYSLLLQQLYLWVQLLTPTQM